MGSEMCIRDSAYARGIYRLRKEGKTGAVTVLDIPVSYLLPKSCLLYTSDAADEEDSVDLGGRRIIKKKIFSSIRRQTR